METEDLTLGMIGILFVTIAVGVIVETSFFVYAYFAADEVECNWIWCTFSSSRESSVESTSSTRMIVASTESHCFLNGIERNCSEEFFNGTMA